MGGKVIVNRRLLKRTYMVLWMSVALLVLVAGCGNKSTSKDSDANLNTNIKRGVKPEPDGEVAVIEMENPAYGKIVIELYPNIAPKMVERFKQLIKEGFYNGTSFHRIDPRLGIIQGGDPLSKDDIPENDGGGDSRYPNVPGEFTDIPYERGIVGAARRGENRDPTIGPLLSDADARETANCQFYITLKRVPGFDANYTVFGRVIEGINNADVIAGAPVEPPKPGRPESSRPAERIVIKSITLQPRK
jgi:cyclophilin family peptidyl-prolyl cis-trans isomerase